VSERKTERVSVKERQSARYCKELLKEVERKRMKKEE